MSTDPLQFPKQPPSEDIEKINFIEARMRSSKPIRNNPYSTPENLNK